jgi:hypothetical protein
MSAGGAAVRGVDAPVANSWTWSDSWWLELRAVGWLVAVTLPVLIVVTMTVALFPSGLDDDFGMSLLGAVTTALFVDMLSAGVAAASALVALPITHLVARLMRPVRSRTIHVIATASLAGVLTMLPAALGPNAAVVFAPLALAAGAAGALARHGEFRRADRLAQNTATAPTEAGS